MKRKLDRDEGAEGMRVHRSCRRVQSLFERVCGQEIISD